MTGIDTGLNIWQMTSKHNRILEGHLAAVIAPNGVNHPARAQLGHAAGNQTVQT